MNQSFTDQDGQQLELRFEASHMYREEVFTDLKVGTIRRLTPVTPDGSEDRSRAPMFVGTFHLMTPGGPLPVEERLAANNLKEAIEIYPQSMAAAAQNLFEELEKMQKERESRIIVPDVGPSGSQGPGSGLL